MPCQRWRSPLLLLPGELQFYKIYRSLDGKAFTPLATQRGDRTRFEDFLGASGKNASYSLRREFQLQRVCAFRND
jgi:hypothetical protein